MIKAGIQIERLGETQAPIVIIDGGSSAIEIIRQVAQKSAFSEDVANNYPGVRASIPKDMVIAYVKPLLPYLYRIFRIPNDLRPQPVDNYFSLITRSNGELNYAQTIPHFDTNNPHQLAIIHYLNSGGFGGTSFYRHLPTGWEFIDRSRRADYLKSVEQGIVDDPNYLLNYCTPEHKLFECYKTVDYRENRLIIFNGYMLHSANVCVDNDIDANPSTGRLTANLFLRFD